MSTSIPIKERPRVATNKTDRFIDLHECILSNILSRLPTKYAVRTSILSKAWKNKWKSLYNVNIDGEFDYDGNNEKFINFMNRIFVSTEYLRSVRLVCRPSCSQPPLTSGRQIWISSFQNWISASLRHNLEYFEVFHCDENIFYPSTLLNNNSLRKLILGPSNTSPRILNLKPSHGTLCISTMNFASNLTSLSLGPLNIKNENPNYTTVTFRFPVLQMLTFRRCEWLNVKHVEIYAPSLATFTSQVINIDEKDYDYTIRMDYDYTIRIVAPRLTTFSCTSEKFILDGSSVVSASLTLEEIDDPALSETIRSRARNLLNEFSSLEELELSISMLMAKVPPLRCHDKLTRLTFRGFDSCDCEQLFELLHATPSLKFLNVNEVHLFDYDDDDEMDVPSCIFSQLEEVVIRRFNGAASEFMFVAFLLNTAEELRKLTVCGSYSDLEFTKVVISEYSICSSSLIVDVINRDEISY